MKELKHDFRLFKVPIVLTPNVLFKGSLDVDQDIFLMYIDVDTEILFSDKV